MCSLNALVERVSSSSLVYQRTLTMNLACYWKQCPDKLYARLLVFLQSNMYMVVPSQPSYGCTVHCETVQVHADSGWKCFLLRGCNVQSKANQPPSRALMSYNVQIIDHFHLFNFNYVAPFNSEVLCHYLTVSGFVGRTTCTISYLCSLDVIMLLKDGDFAMVYA